MEGDPQDIRVEIDVSDADRAGAKISALGAGIAKFASSSGSALAGMGAASSPAAAGLDKLGASTAKTGLAFDETAGRWRTASGSFASGAQLAAAGLDKMGASGSRAGVAALNLGKQLSSLAAEGIGASVDAASKFEKTMSGVAAVSGANQTQLKQLSGLALQLGKDTSFSASEAASGLEELVKGGVSIGDIMAGGAKATLNLAAAGGVSLPKAAEIASIALNTFNLSGKEMAHVSDLIAGAANASAIDVNDFRFSLSAVGAVAHGVGLSIDDTSTAIAVLGANGLKGSDAGTSLKTALLNMAAPTDKAYQLMGSLGIATFNTQKAMETLRANGIQPAGTDANTLKDQMHDLANQMGGGQLSGNKLESAYRTLAAQTGVASNAFFDSTGKIKSMADISQVLQDKLGGMGKQQEEATLKVLFGTDAIRATTIMTGLGAAGFDKMAASMGKVSAEAVAGQRLNNYAGQVEQLKGSIETLEITIGLKLLPVLTDMAHRATDVVNTVLTWTSAHPDLTKVIALTAGAVAGLGLALGAAHTALGPVITLLGAVGAPVLLVGAAVAGLYLAWQTNFLGIRDVVANVWSYVSPVFDSIKIAVSAVEDSFQMGGISQAFETFKQFLPGIVAEFGGLKDAAVSWAKDAIPPLLRELGDLAGKVGGWITGTAAPAIGHQLGEWGKAFVDWVVPAGTRLLAEWPKILDSALDWIQKAAGPIARQIGQWAGAFVGWIVPMLPDLGIALLKISGAVLLFLGETWVTLTKRIGSWGLAFVEWVGPQIKPLLGELGTLSLKLLGWIKDDALPAIGRSLEKWGGAFLAWIEPQVKKLPAELGKIRKEVADWVTGTALPLIGRELESWGAAFLAWIEPQVKKLPAELGKIRKEVTDWVTGTALPLIRDEVGKWAGAFTGWVAAKVKAMPGELAPIAGAVTGWAAGAIKGLGEAVGHTFESIGTSILDGIEKGITDKSGEFTTWVKKKITDILPGPVRGVLESLSPSQVFARIGDDVMGGMRLGIDRSASKVTTAAVDAANATVSVLRGLWSPGGPTNTEVKGFGSAVPAWLADGIRDRQGQAVVTTAATNLGAVVPDAVAKGIWSSLGPVTAAVTAVGNTIGAEVAKQAERARAAAAAMVDEFNAGYAGRFLATGPQLATMSQSFAAQIIQGLVKSRPLLYAEGGTLLTQLRTGLADMANTSSPAIRAKGLEMIQALLDGVKDPTEKAHLAALIGEYGGVTAEALDRIAAANTAHAKAAAAAATAAMHTDWTALGAAAGPAVEEGLKAADLQGRAQRAIDAMWSGIQAGDAFGDKAVAALEGTTDIALGRVFSHMKFTIQSQGVIVGDVLSATLQDNTSRALTKTFDGLKNLFGSQGKGEGPLFQPGEQIAKSFTDGYTLMSQLGMKDIQTLQSGIVKNIVDNFQGADGTLYATGGAAMAKVSQGLQDIADAKTPDVRAHAMLQMYALIDAVQDPTISDLLRKGVDMLGNVAAQRASLLADQNKPALTASGVAMGTPIATGMASSAILTKDAATVVTAASAAALTDNSNITALQAAGGQLGTAMLKGQVAAYIAGLPDALKAIAAANFAAAASQTGSGPARTAPTTPGGMGESWQTHIGADLAVAVSNAFQITAAQVLIGDEKANILAKFGQDLGSKIVDGMAHGLGYFDALQKAIDESTADVQRRFLDQWEIKSPSAWMAREVGKPLMDGLALQIQAGAPGVGGRMAGVLATIGTQTPQAAAVGAMLGGALLQAFGAQIGSGAATFGPAGGGASGIVPPRAPSPGTGVTLPPGLSGAIRRGIGGGVSMEDLRAGILAQIGAQGGGSPAPAAPAPSQQAAASGATSAIPINVHLTFELDGQAVSAAVARNLYAGQQVRIAGVPSLRR